VVEKTALSKERVLAEWVRIAFSDIRKAVEWKGELVRETDNPDGGDVLVIREIFSNHVRLVDGDKIDDAAA
jgi:phage terminase small subunit